MCVFLDTFCNVFSFFWDLVLGDEMDNCYFLYRFFFLSRLYYREMKRKKFCIKTEVQLYGTNVTRRSINTLRIGIVTRECVMYVNLYMRVLMSL